MSVSSLLNTALRTALKKVLSKYWYRSDCLENCNTTAYLILINKNLSFSQM